MTLTITISDLDTLTRLHRDAEERAAKLYAEHADLSIRRAILWRQIGKLDALTHSLTATARAMEAAKPDALRVTGGEPPRQTVVADHPFRGRAPGVLIGGPHCLDCGWPRVDHKEPATVTASSSAPECDPGLLRGKP